MALKDPIKALEELKTVHFQLADILETESEELDNATTNSKKVDQAIRLANPQEAPKGTTSLTCSTLASPSATVHPLMSGKMIAMAHKAALEDLCSSIQLSQVEKANAVLLTAGKGPVAPLLPRRSVEYQLGSKNHQCWALNNINLLAPVSVHMWRTWRNLSNQEMESLKSNATNYIGHLREPQEIPNAFPLGMFDHKKCLLADVTVHTKQDLTTGYDHCDKHSLAL